MSAFIISDKHFSVIAHYVADHTGINPQIIADKLKRINIESVNHRYNEKTRFSKVKLQAKTAEYAAEYTVGDIIRLIQCWSYQSCENALSIDFLIMDAYLLSYFQSEQLDHAKYDSKVWSI